MIHETAEVESPELIHNSVFVWHYAHIRKSVSIGDGSVIGRGVYVGPGVRIGSNCKIQNYALIYEPARIEDGVFLGPGVILTNDKLPRAVNVDLSKKESADWNQVGVVIESGASLGANTVCVAPVHIGKWALIGSGSVVTVDVPDYGLYVGNPARQIGWVGEDGHRLVPHEFGFYSNTLDQYYELFGSQLMKVQT